MRVQQVRSRRVRGLAATELAVTLPIFLALLMGVWEVARMIEVKRLLQTAAREGARQASTGTLTNSQVVSAVSQYLQAAFNESDVTGTRGTTLASKATIQVTNVTTGADSSAATQLDQIQVTVSLAYGDVSWGTSFFMSPTSMISADAYSRSMRDLSYPSVSEPPIE